MNSFTDIFNDFAFTFKEIFRFSKIFRIPLKAASNFILWWTLSKSSKYVPTGNHWTYTSIFKMLSPCGLGKLWVNNKLWINYHLPKVLIFQQLPPILRISYDISLSIRTTAFVIETGKLFHFLCEDFDSESFFSCRHVHKTYFLASALYKFPPCSNKHVLNMI